MRAKSVPPEMAAIHDKGRQRREGSRPEEQQQQEGREGERQRPPQREQWIPSGVPAVIRSTTSA
jgi:hypothetical protein